MYGVWEGRRRNGINGRRAVLLISPVHSATLCFLFIQVQRNEMIAKCQAKCQQQPKVY